MARPALTWGFPGPDELGSPLKATRAQDLLAFILPSAPPRRSGEEAGSPEVSFSPLT